MEESKSQIEISMDGVSPSIVGGFEMNFFKNKPNSINVDLLNIEKTSVVSNEIEIPFQKEEGMVFETPDYNSERVNSNDFIGNGQTPKGLPRN